MNGGFDKLYLANLMWGCQRTLLGGKWKMSETDKKLDIRRCFRINRLHLLANNPFEVVRLKAQVAFIGRVQPPKRTRAIVERESEKRS